MNLSEKLVEVRKSVSYLSKDSKSFNYTYVKGSSVLAAVRGKMDELGLLLFPSVDGMEINEIKNDRSNSLEFLAKGKITYTWRNSEAPDEALEVPFYGAGYQNDPSKAIGSMLTYMERYFLLKFFQIPTDEQDPDGFEASRARQEASRETAKKNASDIKEMALELRGLASHEAIDAETRGKVDAFLRSEKSSDATSLGLFIKAAKNKINNYKKQ